MHGLILGATWERRTEGSRGCGITLERPGKVSLFTRVHGCKGNKEIAVLLLYAPYVRIPKEMGDMLDRPWEFPRLTSARLDRSDHR